MEESETSQMKSFDWQQYLHDTESIAAPLDAFNHDTNKVPENKFQPGQLILVPDKKAYVMVIAKVVKVYRCWLQYQLLGLRDKNLFWLMCDDNTMQPIEPLDKTSDLMTRGAFPITGFMLTNFRKWASKLYEQNADKIVPPSGFAPLGKSFYPAENKFEKGMKLAVLDQRTFSGCLLMGTVIDVGDTDLHVEFDGYDHFIVVPVGSRDIFPFEYVEKIGAELEKPVVFDSSPRQEKLKKTKLIDKEPPTSTVGEEEDDEEDELPKKRRRRSNTSWQQATVILEQATGVTDKVADLLKKAQADLAAEGEKVAEPEKEKPRVVTVQPTSYMFPSTSSQPTHCNMISVYQSPQFLHSPMVNSPVRLAPFSTPVRYQPAIFPIPRQVHYLPVQGNLLSARPPRLPTIEPIEPIVLYRDRPKPRPRPSMSFPAYTPPSQSSLLTPGRVETTSPLIVTTSRPPSVTAELPSMSPATVKKPLSLGEDDLVQFVYSPQCRVPPSLNEAKVKGQMLEHPPYEYANGARVVIYDLLTWAEEPWDLFESLEEADENEPHVEMFWDDNTRRLRKLVAIPGNKKDTIQWVKNLAQLLGCCENFISTSKVRCDHCMEPNDPDDIEDDEIAEPKRKEHCWDDRTIFKKHGLRPPTTDEIAKIFEDELGPAIAQEIKERGIQFEHLKFLKSTNLMEDFQCSYSDALSIVSLTYKIRAFVYEQMENFDEVSRQGEGPRQVRKTRIGSE